MQNTPVHTVFDVLTDFLASKPTDDELLAYHLPHTLQERVDWLVERSGEGLLTFDEQRELFDFIRADQMIGLLKTKVRLRQQNKT